MMPVETAAANNGVNGAMADTESSAMTTQTKYSFLGDREGVHGPLLSMRTHKYCSGFGMETLSLPCSISTEPLPANTVA